MCMACGTGWQRDRNAFWYLVIASKQIGHCFEFGDCLQSARAFGLLRSVPFGMRPEVLTLRARSRGAGRPRA